MLEPQHVRGVLAGGSSDNPRAEVDATGRATGTQDERRHLRREVCEDLHHPPPHRRKRMSGVPNQTSCHSSGTPSSSRSKTVRSAVGQLGVAVDKDVHLRPKGLLGETAELHLVVHRQTQLRRVALDPDGVGVRWGRRAH